MLREVSKFKAKKKLGDARAKLRIGKLKPFDFGRVS